MLVISSRISGWRVTASITLPKMMPMPTPAPTAPRPPPTAIPNPAVIPEAAMGRCNKRNIGELLVVLVVSGGAGDIDRSQGREDERLQRGHQAQLEDVNQDPGRKREPTERLETEDHREPAGQEQQNDVPGKDVGPEPDGQRQQPHQGGDHLD